jgi:hypothetical protein
MEVKMGSSEERQVTPAIAMAILKKHGIDLSIENAKLILDCLYLLANIAVTESRNSEKG